MTFRTVLSLLLMLMLFCACSSSEKITSSSKFNPEEYRNNDTPDSTQIGEESTQVIKFDSPKIKGGLSALYRAVKYPSEAQRKKIQGTVVLEIYINEKGKVRHIDVIQSPHDLLSEAAKEAVRRSKFEPAKRKNKPVKSTYSVPMRFTL